MAIKRIVPDFEYEADGNYLKQLVHEGWKQINILFSKKGSHRGGHYHKVNQELFYIIDGRIALHITDKNISEELFFGKGDMFLISPFCMHNFDFLEDTLMIGMYDIGVEMEDGTKDIFSS